MNSYNNKYQYTFIVNPISGGKDKKAFPDLLTKYLEAAPDTYQILYTEREHHAYELAKTSIHHSDYIVAVGGDGTVHEVVNGIFPTDKPMGIIPLGSGNGLARDLKIPMNEKEAIRVLNAGHITRIDVGRTPDRVFTNSFSLGKVADIAHSFAKLPMRGMSGYILCVLKELFNNKRIEVTLHIDGEKRHEKVALLDVMNISEYGNHLKVAPNASATDGTLHLQLFSKFPWYRLPGWAIQAFFGRPIKSKLFSSISFEHLKIEHGETTGQCDGEPIHLSPGIIEITCHPRALPIFTKADHPG